MDWLQAEVLTQLDDVRHRLIVVAKASLGRVAYSKVKQVGSADRTDATPSHRLPAWLPDRVVGAGRGARGSGLCRGHPRGVRPRNHPQRLSRQASYHTLELPTFTP